MAAPTEAEIREAIEARCEHWPQDNPSTKLIEAIGAFGDFMYSPSYEILKSPDDLTSPSEASDPGQVWTDLRPTEARDLDRLYEAALIRATERTEAAIVEEFVAAALRFAELHPDAPRAQQEAVTVS